MYIESSDYDLPFQVPTFADGTDAEIAKALEMHYAGEIDLADYWTVGDKRTIHLNAMEASVTGIDEVHHADDYEFVIIGMKHVILTISIGNITKAAITVQMDRIFYKNTTDSSYPSEYPSAADEGGCMNYDRSSYGGWRNCPRRTWCNDTFFGSLPQVIQSAIKNVDKLTSDGNQYGFLNTDSDKAFLLSEIEIFGTTRNSRNGEGSQYAYFSNSSSNMYKKPAFASNVSAYWWTRSPDIYDGGYFCLVMHNGTNNVYQSDAHYGICPAFCM